VPPLLAATERKIAMTSRSFVTPVTLMVGMMVGGLLRIDSHAAPPDDAGLKHLVSDLQQQVATLQSQVDTLQTTVSDHGDKLRFVTVSGTDMFITGANLNIRDGSGATNGIPGGDATLANPTGLGNLIIGYNEENVPLCPPGSDNCPGPPTVRPRGGSHNLVVGANHSYTSTGGAVVGFANSIGSVNATVTGGFLNHATGAFSSVSGGVSNTASERSSSVGGGEVNTSSGISASVSGGSLNMASGAAAWVSGGQSNNATGLLASVSGGFHNTASGGVASVSGGQFNEASGSGASVSGGSSLLEDSPNAWAAGSFHTP
jgi:hypothetical protein